MIQTILKTIGMDKPVNVVIYLSILLLFYINFKTQLKVKLLNERVIKLVRNLAIKFGEMEYKKEKK